MYGLWQEIRDLLIEAEDKMDILTNHMEKDDADDIQTAKIKVSEAYSLINNLKGV